MYLIHLTHNVKINLKNDLEYKNGRVAKVSLNNEKLNVINVLSYELFQRKSKYESLFA